MASTHSPNNEDLAQVSSKNRFGNAKDGRYTPFEGDIYSGEQDPISPHFSNGRAKTITRNTEIRALSFIKGQESPSPLRKHEPPVLRQHAFSIDKPVMYQQAHHARNSTALPTQRRRVDNSLVGGPSAAGKSATKEGHSRKQISFSNSRHTKAGFAPFEDSSATTKFGFNPDKQSRTLKVKKQSNNGIVVTHGGQRSILRSVQNSEDGGSLEMAMGDTV